MKANNCPFCGGKICRPDSDFKGSWVLCFGCLARGPRANTAEEAVEKWNTLDDQWVSVDDRLPDVEDPVLALCLRDEVIVADYYNHNEWHDLGNDHFYLEGTVTHWMPLPEPPKGVE